MLQLAALIATFHLLSIFILSTQSHSVDGLDNYDSCLCRRCGHEVVQGHSFKRILSKLALSKRNTTINGHPNVDVQLFNNPAGEQFEIVTVDQADVYKAGKAYVEDTWFPGYAWTVGVCPKCGAHLGWFFERNVEDFDQQQTTKDSFVGLILDALLSEAYASTLTIVPKPKNERSF